MEQAISFTAIQCINEGFKDAEILGCFSEQQIDQMSRLIREAGVAVSKANAC